jgi:hypothetical protein
MVRGYALPEERDAMQPTKDQATVLAQAHGHVLSTWRHEANEPILANWSAQCTNRSCRVWVYIRDRDGTAPDSGIGRSCPYPETAGDVKEYIDRSMVALLDDLIAKRAARP